MIVKTTVTETSLGKLTMTRSDKAEEFYCERCGCAKKSKNKATWEQEATVVTICNGCYGFLIAKSRE
jgi:hypothetical protein